MKYSEYRFSKSELLNQILIFGSVSILIGVLFYDNLLASLAMLPLFPFFLKRQKGKLKDKRYDTLRNQFCEMIEAIASSLSAGMSVENAFIACETDMQNLFGKDSYITKEVRDINRKISLNKTVEECIHDFAKRSNIEEVKDFSVIFLEAKKNGGDMKEIINKSVSMITERLDCEKQIKVILKGKLFEQRIMTVIPFFIILYLRISNMGFMDVLYHNVGGIAVMSSCLAVYVVSAMLAERIATIKV